MKVLKLFISVLALIAIGAVLTATPAQADTVCVAL